MVFGKGFDLFLSAEPKANEGIVVFEDGHGRAHGKSCCACDVVSTRCVRIRKEVQKDKAMEIRERKTKTKRPKGERERKKESSEVR